MFPFLTWLFLCLILYVYLIYPLIVFLMGMIWRRTVRKEDWQPMVTFITCAYNEESHIRETIENKLSQNYPQELLEYVVVSDASTDRTSQILRSLQETYHQKGMSFHVIEHETRQGKTAGLNKAIELIRARVAPENAFNHIIVFSDANSLYDPQAVQNLVRNFHDTSVGYVTGKMVYRTVTHSSVSEGCGAYMRYENMLRTLETNIGSIVGVDGGIDAVRLSLYVPMTKGDLPDFVLPLNVIEQGFRVVYEPEARLFEEALQSSTSEFSMRVRVALRAYHAMQKKMHLINPFGYGLFGWQFLSHKVMRYDIGWYQGALFLCTIFSISHGIHFQVLLALQELCYAAALLGWWYDKRGVKHPLFYIPYYFCLLNAASLVAALKFFKGENAVTWTPRKG